MDQIICRDCAMELPASARGCPGCALNLEVEEMIDRVVWRRILPVLVVVIILVGVFVFLR